MPEAKRKVEPGRGASEEAPLEAAFKLVASLPVPVFFKSRDGRYLGVNRAWERFFGVSRAEFIGKQVADLYPDDPAIAERHARMDEELYARGGGQSYEIRIRTRSGELRDTLYYKSTYAGADGAVAGLIGTIVDITDRKRAESALGESEARYRRTFELAGSGVAHIGLDRRFVRVNRRMCEILGYSESELLQLTGRQISHPDDLDIINTPRPLLHAGEIDRVHVEKRYLRKDGSTVWVALTLVVERDRDGRPLYEIAIYDDITGRKHAEEALRESEARFRETFELAGSGMAHVSLEGRFLRVNRRLCDILGRSEAELIGRSVKDISHPEDRDVTDAQRARVRRGEIAVAHLEKRYLDGQGRTVWVDLAVALARGKQGEPLYEIAVFDDITERKKGDALLRESEARFRSLTQLSSDWYWEQDAAFGLKYMSGRMGERTGLDAASYVGRKRWDQPALNLGEEDWARHRAQLECHEPFRDFVMERPNPAGGSRWISVSGEPIFDEAGRFTGYRGVGSDITERMRAESELQHAHDELAHKARELERSNAELEQFAYVASHDLQEPLRMVSSYTQLIARRYGEKLDGDAKEFMNYVVDGAARMKQLIEDLLAYSRVGTKGKEFRSIELDSAFKRAVGNLRAAIEESGASVSADPLPRLSGDDGQLAQLFQNLIGNALKFRGANTPRVHVSCSDQAKQYEIIVADNGIGIEPQYYERIFMVFQRLHTKEYPGTGIGLAICKKVVERHGGAIWVTSRPGEGSQFHFTLPKNRNPEETRA
jgi:PAS domain S-box-containing protein